MKYLKPLSETHPHLASQWHPTRNTLTPREIGSGSNRKIWWLGECGHEWEAKINARVKGTNCPYCSNRKVLPGFNDLGTTHPHLASQWHPTRNKELTPKKVTAGSTKKIWWQCDKGHEWEASLVNRKTGTACPVCAGNQPQKTNTSLATTHPEIAELWDIGNKTQPTHVTPKSEKQVTWHNRNCGHTWVATVKRTVNSHGECPVCSETRTKLSYTHPHIAEQWHKTKNTDIALSETTHGSGRTVWWVCELGHEWEARVSHRTFYNSLCPYCGNQRPLPGFNDLATTHPEIAELWDTNKNTLTPAEVTYGSAKPVWWRCPENHQWLTPVFKQVNTIICSQCNTTTSAMEREIADLCREHVNKVETSNKTIIPPQELDIYLPEQNIAIEFNGLYWHTENQGKHRTYHYNKWLQCKNQGIQLIQIWEDDWKRNPGLVRRTILRKINRSTEPTIYARKTTITHLTTQTAQNFLNNNHIQGFASGTHYLGLLSPESKLVAVLTVKQEHTTLNIIRYATSANVVGGFTKLLKHAERTYKPEKFITFSDHCISDGGLYEKNGFTADKELPPDYMYVVRGERKHKFGYRLKKFRDDPNLLWEEGLTEKQLAELNQIPRIWDAGKTRWVKHC